MSRGHFARIAGDYLALVMPLLRERENRVFLAVALFDFDALICVRDLAHLVRTTERHVREALATLRSTELVSVEQQGPNGSRGPTLRVRVGSNYQKSARLLERLGRSGPLPKSGMGTPAQIGQGSPYTDLRSGSLGGSPRSRSPFPPSTRAAPDGRKVEVFIPEKVLAAAARYWPELDPTAARRFLARIATLGEPPPTADELARYLKKCSRDPSLEPPRCEIPLAAACTAHRFQRWLRAVRATPVASTEPASGDRPSGVFPTADAVRRAQQIAKAPRGGRS